MDERKKILAAILAATLVFALALALVFGLSAAAAKRLPGRIEAALEKGDAARAEKLIARLGAGEEKAVFENRLRFSEASALLEDGEYRAAAAAFAALGDYDGAEENFREALYRLAGQELEAGDFDTAQRRFEALGNYRDAAEMARRAQMAKAEALETEGRIYDAFLLLYRLQDETEARERALALAEKICGRRDLDAAFAVAQDLSSEELARRAELKAKREALPRGIVDVGFYHTLALKTDGTVLACGDDSFGQCGVDKWQRVKAVSAGAYHSVALFADGTALLSHESARSDELTELVDVAVNTGCAVGLRADGTAVCAAADLSAWHELVAVEASANAVFGLDAQGAVHAHFFRTGAGEGFSAPGGVVAMAAGGTHCVFVRSDGTLAAWGENEHGECEVAAWDLF